MKVIIKQIKMLTRHDGQKYVDIPDRRAVSARVLDSYGKDADFELPSIEVDGLIVVGGTYELIFARRES